MKNTITLTLLAASVLTFPAFGQGQDPDQALPATNTPAAAPAAAQEPPASTTSGGGWRRVGEAQPRDEFGQLPSTNSRAPQMNSPAPSQLIIPAGTWIKIRVDQPLSSDRNNPGDSFSATLAQPLIADGFVVARRGQAVEGRVSEAIKAGRSKGTSRLGIELTQMGLVDGRQMPLRTELMEYSGGTSVGRDLAAAGTVTGTGAAIGAAAGGGVGAAIGAAVGAAASGIGVLTTRGRATEVYPEAEVTFRTMAPITISTDRAAQAFTPVRQEDFEPRLQQRRSTTIVRNGPIYPYFGGGYWGGGNYWGGYSPFWGPSFSFYSNRRFGYGYGGGFGGGYRGGGGFRGRR